MLRPKVFLLLLEAIAHGPGIEQFQGQERGKFRLNMALVLGEGMNVKGEQGKGCIFPRLGQGGRNTSQGKQR